MSDEALAAASAQACDLIKAQGMWRHADWILVFAPLRREPDIWPLVEEALLAGKSVALPRFHPPTGKYEACEVKNLQDDIASGHWSIREPRERCAVALNQLDLVLVPGVAFDLHGRRLGRGKGFYDQLLAAMSGTKCGVAFDQQIVREVPIEPHDVHVNCILTPTRWIEL